ncbi:hypothetical protein AUJ16_02355 [Candidatus Micrarchaeota archaeon CG1_02_60_51]|nr:MAG: hypothetical protein AUJ16_02355 [Candidatus Micrarchaeota archaeon CG1_02_60_51]
MKKLNKPSARVGEKIIGEELGKSERAFRHPHAIALKSENPKAYLELLARVRAAAKIKKDPLEYSEIVELAKKLRKKK